MANGRGRGLRLIDSSNRKWVTGWHPWGLRPVIDSGTLEGETLGLLKAGHQWTTTEGGDKACDWQL